MKLFIDGEWNGYQGDLISLALVAEDGSEWYEVLDCKWPRPWVTENVMPKLGKQSVTRSHMQYSLAQFLQKFECVHVIADWPEDIERFLRLLITGEGTRMGTPPLTMEILRVDTISKTPHNALADAQALRDWYIAQLVQSKEYKLSEADVKNRISWLRSGHVDRACRALENLNPAIAQSVQPAETCIWAPEDQWDAMPDTYTSACGELWSFDDGGPAENEVRFCHGCGKPVEVQPQPVQPALSEALAIIRGELIRLNGSFSALSAIGFLQLAIEDAPPAETCIWTAADQWDAMPDTFASACGELWSFIDGGPAENEVRFCHGCGKPVQVATR